MRVLMFSLDPSIVHPEKGAGKRMRDYATLVETLTIVLFSTGGPKQVHGNLTICPTSSNKILSFFSGLWFGYRVLRRGSYDLITVQEPFATALIGFLLASLFRIPIQVQVHSTFFSPFWKESIKNSIYQTLAKIFVPRAACVRAVSERIKKDLTSALNVQESRISVIPIFTDAKRIANTAPSFDLHAKYQQFDFIALIASRLVKQKNIELAIGAIKELVTQHTRLGLIIVGAGPHEDELRKQCVGFEDNIMFEGWSDDVVSYYKGADVFLLPSNYEGWAMSVIEAMAASTPVIMTDVGCAGEVVKDGSNGIVISIGDKDALVRGIERLYKDPKERERLAKAGRETALTMVPRTWEEYLVLYKKDFEKCIELYKRQQSSL